MYGIVNKSIEELVITNYGEGIWKEVLEKSGIEVDFFISNEPYDDQITYQLAGAISSVLNVSVSDVLFLFGEWWILKTTTEKYGGLMRSGGQNLKEFLENLPQFHSHIMLMYPKLTPPEFKVSDIESNSLHVHYLSKRDGLSDFVKGLLSGLAKLYETKVEIELLESRDKGNKHEIFKVSWFAP
jgi:hypothetical protein